MPRVLKRQAAKRDLTQHFIYLAEHANLSVARRFKNAAKSTFLELSKMPDMGTPGRVRHGKFEGVRLWQVRGFARYLIAYRSLDDGVLIERVFHSAQDYQRVLK
jgi:toxin ParE1/3/4